MKLIKNITLSVMFIVGFIISAQVFTISDNIDSDQSNLISSPRAAAVTTWTEQSFNEAFWGDGLRQLRRRFEARGRPANTDIVLENTRFVGAVNNNTSLQQQGRFTHSIRTGHQISATAGARSRWLQLEVGYTFTRETITSHEVTIQVAPGRRVELWQSDVRIQQQWVWVDVFQQRFSGGFLGIGGSWRDTGNSWFEDELIREFAAHNFLDLREFPAI